jgi:hypothetical protein
MKEQSALGLVIKFHMFFASKAKSVPLHALKALVERERIAPTHS